MKKKKPSASHVLDSFALLSYYNNEQGSDTVEDFLKKASEKKVSLYVSEITIGEVYYIVLRERGKAAAELMFANLLKLPIEVVSVDLTSVLTAATYKSRGHISYADCFVLAVAHEKQGHIVTGDPEFEPFEDEFPIIWLQK